MDRKILFKGKNVDTGEWIEGSLITNVFYRRENHKSIPYILCPDKAEFECFEDFDESNGIYEVDEETICQYTGLTDKNGKKIFEGDILEAHLDDIYPDNITRVTVEFTNGGWRMRQGDLPPDTFEDEEGKTWTVVGNVFDNPELLKGE